MDPSHRDHLLSDVQHNKPYALGDGQVAGNQHPDQEHHKPALHKRLKHKILHNDPEVAAFKEEAPQVPHMPAHETSQDYAVAIGHAVVAQALLELSQPRNVAVLSSLTTEITGQIGRQLQSEPGRRGFRNLLNEAVIGGYDAVERKAKDVLERLPAPMYLVLAGVVAYFGLMAVGLLLAIWRFVLLGF